MKLFFKLFLLFLTFNFFIAVTSCTSTTGIKPKSETFDESNYKEEKKIYIYRPHVLRGIVSVLIIELNNKQIGAIGNKQIVEASVKSGKNKITVFGDMNQGNYTLDFQANSKDSIYFLALFDKDFGGGLIKIKKLNFEEWVSYIKKDLMN